MKIGSTTGFIRSMVDVLLEEGRKQGFHPDCTVAGGLPTPGYQSSAETRIFTKIGKIHIFLPTDYLL